jgi:hypothetical protein
MASWTWADTYTGAGTLGTLPLVINWSSSAPGSDQIVLQRNFQYELQPLNLSQPPLMFEGMMQPTQMTLAGAVLYQTQVDLHVKFFKLQRTTLLTDDRGFGRLIYPTEYTYQRITSALFPWKGSFQIIASVFSMTLNGDPWP